MTTCPICHEIYPPFTERGLIMKRVDDLSSNIIGIFLIILGIVGIYFALMDIFPSNALLFRIFLIAVAILLICLSLFLLIWDITDKKAVAEYSDEEIKQLLIEEYPDKKDYIESNFDMIKKEMKQDIYTKKKKIGGK